MIKEPHLETSRLTLRPLSAATPDAMVSFYKQNREYFAPTDPPHPDGFYSREFWIERIALATEEFNRDLALRLVLSLRTDPSSVIGAINYTSFLRGPFQACFVGYALDESHTNRGLMTEALRSSIAFVFGELNIRRIMANYLPENHGSAAVLQKLGFTIEGTAKEYLYIDGAWRDHVLTSLISPHWRPIFAR